MRATTNIQLESKECRALIAFALGIPVEKVVSTHYGFAVQGVSEQEIAAKLAKLSQTHSSN